MLARELYSVRFRAIPLYNQETQRVISGARFTGIFMGETGDKFEGYSFSRFFGKCHGIRCMMGVGVFS